MSEKIKSISGNILTQSNIRWTIVALLFFATTINYIDRQVIGLLKPFIQDDLHWDEADYGYIVTAFQIAYAIGMVVSGRLLDRFGTRIGYTMSIFIWSIGAALHSIVRSVFGFGAVRAVLGFGEAGNFPAAVKTIAEWFPKKDRALATGIFNSGSTIGAIIAPIIVVGITINMGWKWAFIITGTLGFIWILFWLIFYQAPEKHKRLSQSELNYIRSDKQVEEIKGLSWGELLKFRQTYAICFSRFITDWVWWFFLFWMPDFLNKTQGIDIKASVLPIIIIYSMASLGGIFGGALSSGFIKAGRSVDFSRKTAILICAVLVLPLIFVSHISNLWIVAVIIGFAGAAHQGWASNIYTIVSDIYPKNTVGTMIGLSGFTGAIGGALSASFVGLLLKFTGSYTLIFVIASSMYIFAWLVLKLFIPKIQELNVDKTI
jgi:MFS transporter, ACS family, hexuronate transporter